jgi:hypothetical protein
MDLREVGFGPSADIQKRQIFGPGLTDAVNLWLEFISSDSNAILPGKAFDCAAADLPLCSHIFGADYVFDYCGLIHCS